MTIDQLQVFQTILKTGSFRAASQKLNRAQSAVSYAIRTLEEELGFSLFDRDRYRPQATSQGKSFALKMDDVLRDFEELRTSARFLQLGHEPVIRLAVSGLWPMNRLAKILRDFKKKFPQTEIKIYHDVLSGEQMLLKNQVDLMLSEVQRDNNLIVFKELFNVTLVPVCAPDFALALKKGKARIEDLRKHTQIILRSTSEDNQRSAGIFNPADTISVVDFLSKKELLVAGLGWGFMPEHLVKDELRQKKLIHTHNERMQIPMSIGYNPNQARGPCALYLWESLAEK